MERILFSIVAIVLISITLCQTCRTTKTLFGVLFIVTSALSCAFYLFQFGGLSSFYVEALTTKVNFIKEKAKEAKEDSEAIKRMKQEIEEFEKDAEEKYRDMSKQLNILRGYNDIERLKIQALNGDRASFEALIRMGNLKEDLKAEASRAALKSIFAFYGPLQETVDVTYTDPNGKEFKNEDIPTQELLNILLKDKNPPRRASAAYYLYGKREKIVPKILLDVMKKENDLNVASNALKAFRIITGCPNYEVLGFDEVEEWWNKHKEQILLKLK